MTQKPAGEGLDYLQSIIDTVREPFLVLDTDLRVVSANRSFYQTFQVSPRETEGEFLLSLGNGQWTIPALRRLLQDIVPRDTAFTDFTVDHVFPHIGHRTMLLNARKLYRPGNHAQMILLAIEDVTERRKTEAALRAAHERERRIAQALQRPLTTEVAEGAFAGVSVATLYAPASPEAEIGGDFFDAFALPYGGIALVVADVTGKGLAAAAHALQVREVLRAFARESPQAPDHVMARLNDYVCDAGRLQDGGGGEVTLVCLTLAVLEPARGTGQVVSAGSEPALVVRAGRCGDAAGVEEIRTGGMVLGLRPGESYTPATIRLAPGDTLLMLTDGVTEARSASEAGGGLLGYDGMAALAREALPPRTSLRAAGQAILDGARAFAGGRLEDDACLLLATLRQPG